MVGHNHIIIVPVSAQGESFRSLFAIHQKRHGKFIADHRFYPQKRQDPYICGRLIGSLFWQPPFNGIQEHILCLVGIRVTDLHMRLMKGHSIRHPAKFPKTIFLDQRIILNLLNLFRCQILKAPMRIAARLAEVGLLITIYHGHSDCKDSRK